VLKVIIETCMLSDEEIIKVCEICSDAGVDFVKTSTGFNGEGATPENIRLIRDNIPEHIQIKAAGGIRTLEFAEAIIRAGADRIGSSSGVKIIKDS
jgi:deoxyribose-phosphate aldolase